MNLLWRLRSWFKTLVAAGYGGKKLFVEQLEDRCFLSAVPINDGSAVAVEPPTSDNPFESSLLGSDEGSQHTEQSTQEEQDSEAAVASALELPRWAKQQIAESGGEFVEAFQIGNQGTVVHFKAANGDAKVLYRDAAMLQEVSLTDVIVSQLSNVGFGEQNIRQIDDLSVSVETSNSQTQTEVEGVATLESLDGVIRRLGFTLRFRTSHSIATPATATPFPSSGQSTNDQPAASRSLDESNLAMGPQLPMSLRDPVYGDFAGFVQADFWLPDTPTLALDDTDDHELIPPQWLLPDPTLRSPLADDTTLADPNDVTDMLFEEPTDLDIHDETTFQQRPNHEADSDILESLLDEETVHDGGASLDQENLLPQPDRHEDADAKIDSERDSNGRKRSPRGSKQAPQPSRLDRPDGTTQKHRQLFDEADENSEKQLIQRSAHAGDVNAFNRGARSSAKSESPNDQETADAAEASLPKSTSGSREEPPE